MGSAVAVPWTLTCGISTWLRLLTAWGWVQEEASGERMFLENQRGSCWVSSDPASQVTKHLLLYRLPRFKGRAPTTTTTTTACQWNNVREVEVILLKTYLTGIWLTTFQIYQVLSNENTSLLRLSSERESRDEHRNGRCTCNARPTRTFCLLQQVSFGGMSKDQWNT